MHKSVAAMQAIPKRARLRCFQRAITRAFLNLISNGFYGRPGKYSRICICDNGTGISSEAKEKIFNPFLMTRPAGEGDWLGLSMISL
jgi:two-component system, NtrC family, sensor kinase